MRQFYILFLWLFFSFLNSVSGQNISVYTSPIDHKTKGLDLDKLQYDLVESGVVNYNNGEWAAVKVNIPFDLEPNENFIRLSYALLDTVELWMPNNNKQLFRAYQTGQAFEFATRPYVSSDYVFPTKKGVQDYYFRVYSSKPVVIPIEVLSTDKLFKQLTAKDFVFGIFTGLVLVMFLYNLVLYFITRDNSYAYYVAYLFALVVTQLALFGYTDRFLMPDWPILNQKFAVLSGAIVAIVSVFFIINFLHLKEKAPFYAKLISIVLVLDVIGIFYLVLGWDVLAFHWVNVTSLYGSIIGILAGIKVSLTGFKPGKFFLIAWSFFLLTVIIFALTNIGILPYKPYFHGAMLIGASFEAILLSVALADRINVLRNEKEESQELALQMAKDKQQMIKEQNVMLEQKVKRRTNELQKSNEELTVAINNLKSAQSQLVQSEKMASLGILTAGVAHELNNPMNFIHGGVTAINEELKKSLSDLNKEDIYEYLQWIKSGEERATMILKSLNIYSSANDNYSEDCNINSIIEDCLLILKNKINVKTKIVKELQQGMSIVRGNNSELHQAILNLLSNAIDFIEDRGMIKITTKTKEDSCLITVEDNGIGISKDNLKKILDPFFTTKSPSEGTGLGLSIVHSIIKKHRGLLSFDSELGQGTKIEVSLPLV